MMKKFSCLFMLLLFSLSIAKEDLNLLSGSTSPQELKKIILSASQWHPYPKAKQISSWQIFPEKVRDAHITHAESYLNAEWPTPKATLFLEYARMGNRSHYERVSFGRREQLAQLVIAECIEGKGRFLDDIVNGIWTICEETFWGVPAHLYLQKHGPGLPDVSEPTVDLFAAETGMLMSWIYYLLGDQLDTVSSLIKERIKHEVTRRIIDVNLQRNDFGWMGLDPDLSRRVNNWNPWICSNWLVAVLLIEDDEDKRAHSIYKIMRCLDQFINPYPRDGGCDEGPGYFDRAGASLYDCLALLNSASQGKINIFNHSLIQEIGKYIYRVHISDNYYINFADASAVVSPDANIIYNYGKNINDKTLQEFGHWLAFQQNLGNDYVKEGFGCLTRTLATLFNLNQLLSDSGKEPFQKDIWFPELQVMAARSYDGNNKGLFVAAKGGHNDESHNHNDVGNFIIYVNGFPVIIDIGVETYTAQTFSSERYDIWTMQSGYHNCPTINGLNQKNGRQYEASNVTHKVSNNKVEFNLDISKAYPKEAKVKYWKRKIVFDRNKVVINDRYQLIEKLEKTKLSLMTLSQPTQVRQGQIELALDSGKVYIDFDSQKFETVVEPITIKDNRLLRAWGEKVYRIVFTAKKSTNQDSFDLVVHQ